MKKNKLIQNILWFSVVFILAFISTKLTGNFGQISYGPISFKETIEKIPEMLVFSVIVLILGNIADRNLIKSEEKSIEAARKRIEERERQEKKQKLENSGNIKQEDDKQEKK